MRQILSIVLLPLILLGLIAGLYIPANTDPAIREIRPLHLGWLWATDKNIKLLPWVTVDSRDIYYVASEGSAIFALEAQGEILWTFQSDFEVRSDLKLSPDESTLYFIAYDAVNQQFSLDALTVHGELKWVYPTAYGIWKIVVAPGGDIFINAYGWERVTPEGTGEIIWPEEAEVRDISFDTRGWIYSKTKSRNVSRSVISISLPDGTLVRTCEEMGNIPSPVAGFDGWFYYATNTHLVAKDSNCRERWRIEIDTTYISIKNGYILVGPGIVYVLTENHQVVGLDAYTGGIVWESEKYQSLGHVKPQKPRYVLIGKRGEVFTINAFGELRLYGSEGTLLWTELPYGTGAPGNIAINSRFEIGMVQGYQLKIYTDNPHARALLPPPAPPPADQASAEFEIVEFFRSYLLEEWLTPYKSLEDLTQAIIWEKDTDYYKGWWNENGVLVEIGNNVSTTGRLAEVEMRFTITSISKDKSDAVIDLTESLCSSCFGGFRYILHRAPSGEWWIVSSMITWLD